jgi:hypothetical protein
MNRGPIAREIGMNSGINCLGHTHVAPREMINEIAKNCDAVIIVLSDCGSCTSCSTHDLNDLDKKGLAGISVLTTEFEQASESQKSAIGFGAAAVYVPHPLQNKTTQELHVWADEAIDSILAAICDRPQSPAVIQPAPADRQISAVAS